MQSYMVTNRKSKHPKKLHKLRSASPGQSAITSLRKKSKILSIKIPNSVIKYCTKLSPKLSSSNSSKLLPLKIRNTSVDEDLEKLESLTSKNLSARYDWLSIETKLIELSTKKKLSPITETEINNTKLTQNTSDFSTNSINLLKKYENSFKSNASEKLNHLNNHGK
ncbi:hypothetical protein SteCoe_2576 [Stentor coeruleus]|uniref:Uncharacterized protein n=1 Tax=Stentor coeruleus TaxID=5963 RepID=A0A1R2CZ25_9CILI|nr:hypothetical protein SteCoe_2576 [Stentor coeruleus]